MAVIADVFEMILIDNDGDVIGTTTLQDGNIEVAVQEQDVRGARGNQLLGVLHSDRDINISTNDIQFRFDWMAKQFGQDIVTGAGKAYAMPKWYLVKDNNGTVEIELENTPSTVNEMAIYNEEGKKVTGFSVTDNKVTFVSASPTVAIGDEVEIRTYVYDTPAETQEFKIDNSVFAKGVKAVLETVEVDESEERVTHKLQYEFYKAVPTGNFSINTAAERSAQAQANNLRVVKPRTSTEVGVVKRIPVDVTP
ncbi:hypothetical protein [Bacillus sp. AG4(2022)]|uniref:hypothetical protein n=1 Tax=Bacillus sp. AG4(2022) TaxID=2962594 RepID=UPI0028824C7C|nr:hypothetical protein [Bacillus sp. AG4(2022)]MDT0160273.1 hypothetical protein [Bacillus sp. AG4(2022)]